jgi:hypothetical protein
VRENQGTVETHIAEYQRMIDALHEERRDLQAEVGIAGLCPRSHVRNSEVALSNPQFLRVDGLARRRRFPLRVDPSFPLGEHRD